jgi:hypothetical protein
MKLLIDNPAYHFNPLNPVQKLIKANTHKIDPSVL